MNDSREKGRRRVRLALLYLTLLALVTYATGVGAGVTVPSNASRGNSTALADSTESPEPTKKKSRKKSSKSRSSKSKKSSSKKSSGKSSSKKSGSKKSTSKRSSSKKSSSKKSKRTDPVQLSGTFALRVIYDENFIHYSEDDLNEFATLRNVGKFSIDTSDDWIIRPRLDTTLRTDRLTGKRLDIRLRISNWYYTGNSVKNNDSYSLRFKHPGFGKDNFEFNLYYAPESYLRNFRDRAPFTPRSTRSQYTNFSYTSNSGTLSYWRKLSAKLDGKLSLARSLRYYNQPFMENDVKEWRFGGYATYKFHKRFRVRGEYLYSHVTALALDSVGETRETSDDGDGSYERDAYKGTLFWRPRRPVFKYLKSAAASFAYQAYYFTTDRPYYEDEYHVGRKDQIYRFEATLASPKVWGPMTLEGGYRFTKRTSSAAFDSDNAAIGEDKDYEDNRAWFGANYPF